MINERLHGLSNINVRRNEGEAYSTAMPDIKISVIIPVYKVQETLCRCVDSVLNQTYGAYEIILVDDGSPDNCGKICDDYARMSAKVIVIHKENEGLGYARNTGMGAASGDYFLFIDSDDYIGAGFMESLARAVGDADAVVAGYTRVGENGEYIGRLRYDPNIYTGSEVKDKFLSRMAGGLPGKSDAVDMGAIHVLYSAKIIRNHEVFFPSEKEYISEDIIFNFRFFPYADKVALTDCSDYYYVERCGSLTKSYREDRLDRVIFIYKAMRERLDEVGVGREGEMRLAKSLFNWIRMCLAQEKGSVSGKSILDVRRGIAAVMDDETLREVIDSYPVNELGISQWLFIYIIKMRLYTLMTALVLLKFTDL